jgi:hypothetical protein
VWLVGLVGWILVRLTLFLAKEGVFAFDPGPQVDDDRTGTRQGRAEQNKPKTGSFQFESCEA